MFEKKNDLITNSNLILNIIEEVIFRFDTSISKENIIDDLIIKN